MYKNQSITVIIPCLNEEQGIEQILRAMPAFVDEVIVVDNASPMAPRRSPQGWAPKSFARCARLRPELQARLREAIGDLIVTLDGDHSTRWMRSLT